MDLAVESGGNVEGSQLDQTVVAGGVKIIGLAHLPGRVAVHASQMYSSNVFNLIGEVLAEGTSRLRLDLNHEVLRACLVTHQHRIVNEKIRKSINQ